MSGTKPGIDHLKVGDEVVVIETSYRSGERFRPARITKINRVWWEFEEIITDPNTVRNPVTWRMRKTTQRTGGYQGERYGDRFATAEQIAWEDRNRAADRYLREIQLEAWRCKVIDKVTLANMIRKHLGLEEI